PTCDLRACLRARRGALRGERLRLAGLRPHVGAALVGQTLVLDVEDASLRVERRLHVLLLLLAAVAAAPASAAALSPEPSPAAAFARLLLLLLLAVRCVLRVPRVPRLGRIVRRRLGFGPRGPLSFTVHLYAPLCAAPFERRFTSSANDRENSSSLPPVRVADARAPRARPRTPDRPPEPCAAPTSPSPRLPAPRAVARRTTWRSSAARPSPTPSRPAPGLPARCPVLDRWSSRGR